MNFFAFRDELHKLQESVQITVPRSMKVQKSYWGSAPTSISGMPVSINNMSEPNRELGFGQRTSIGLRINWQLLVARARVEDERSSEIATAFWFAAKDVFDQNTTINDTVDFAVLNGAQPTVPVVFDYAGISFIGFNAFIDITNNEGFNLG